MTDTTKLIAELEGLEKKATPGPWERQHLFSPGSTYDDHKLAVAMRNALPELLQKIQQLESMTDFLAVGCEVLPEVYDERDAAIARAEKAEAEHKKTLVQTVFEFNRAEQMQAERNVLAEKLVGMGFFPGTPEYREQVKKWLEYAAQEAAKREEGV